MQLQNNTNSIYHNNYKPIAQSIQSDLSTNLKKYKNKHIFRLKSKFPSLQINSNLQNTQHKFKKNGHWSQQQNKKYFLFLNAHNHQFHQKSLRRSERIFKLMSNYIATRSASQCRSHHQKMQKKCLTFQKIIDYLLIVCQYKEMGQNEMNNECRKIKQEYWINSVQQVQDLQQVEMNNENEERKSYEMPRDLQPCYSIKCKSERQSSGQYLLE